jgi:hypothetical protein
MGVILSVIFRFGRWAALQWLDTSIQRYDEGYECEHARHESIAADATAAAMAYVVVLSYLLAKM